MELVQPHITIWQQNVNKSPTCQHDLISSKSLIDIEANIVALQEPAICHTNKTIATKDWIVLYPSTHDQHPEQTRSVILIRAALKSDSWQQLDFPSRDVTTIQLTGIWGHLNIYSIYNDCQHSQTINLLSKHHYNNAITGEEAAAGKVHNIWLGDFNRHHPHWDDPEDMRLFMRDALNTAETLIQ
jgi:hypothetical protein